MENRLQMSAAVPENHKEKIKISVLVPFYNVEKYAARCIESLINQTYGNLELIFVDDVSTDSTIEILREYEKKDPRIRVIQNSQNLCCGLARNTGLEIATGDYITGADGDDFLEHDIYEKAVAAIERNDMPDMLVFNYSNDYEDGSSILSHTADMPLMNTEWDGGAEYFMRFLLSHNHANSCCNKLFKKSVIDEYGLRFEDSRKVLFEDCCFTWTFALYMKTVCAIGDTGYHYCIRKKSLSDADEYKMRAVECFPRIVNHLRKHVTRLHKEEQYRDVLPLAFLMLTVAYLINYKHVMRCDISGSVKYYSEHIDGFYEYMERLTDKNVTGLLKKYTKREIRNRTHSRLKPCILIDMLCSKTVKIAREAVKGNFEKAERYI